MQERATLHARLFLAVQGALGCRDRWAGVWGPRPGWGAGVLLSRPAGHRWFCPTRAQEMGRLVNSSVSCRPAPTLCLQAGRQTLVLSEPLHGNPCSGSHIHKTRVLEPSALASGGALLPHASCGPLGGPPPLWEPQSPCLEVGVMAGQDRGWRLALGPVQALPCVSGRQSPWLPSSPPGGASPLSGPKSQFGERRKGRPVEDSPQISYRSLLEPDRRAVFRVCQPLREGLQVHKPELLGPGVVSMVPRAVCLGIPRAAWGSVCPSVTVAVRVCL